MSTLHFNVGQQGGQAVSVGASDGGVDVQLSPHLLPPPEGAVHMDKGRVEG